MPSCVVKWCKNNSNKNKKVDEVTYHSFPTRRETKKRWLDAIRLSRNDPSWNPSIFSKICSIHFENDDLYVTNKGLRRVLRTGYPKKYLTNPEVTRVCPVHPRTSKAYVPARDDESIKMDSSQPCTLETTVLVTHVESFNKNLSQPCTSEAHVPATNDESKNVDFSQPCTLQTHVSATPVESINVDLSQPSTSEATVPAIPFESINVDPLQPCTSQTLEPATAIESIIINVEPIHPYTMQAHFSDTPAQSTPDSPTSAEYLESLYDTPRKHKLRTRVSRLEKQLKLKNMKIRALNQKVRRLERRNKSLKEVLENLINLN